MKNFKYLLKLVSGATLFVCASSSLVACNNNASQVEDISSGVMVEDLHTTADTTATYSQLNWFTGITDMVDAAISNVFGINVRNGLDFILTNDQVPEALQAAGTLVTFTVTAIDSLLGTGLRDDEDAPNLVGSFSFTDRLSFANISKGVQVDDQSIPYSDNLTYKSLNSNIRLTNAVIDAIMSSKNNLRTSYPKDFILANDNTPGEFAKKGDKIVMIAIGRGYLIKGSFTFNVIIT